MLDSVLWCCVWRKHALSLVLWLERAGLVCQWFCGLGELAWCVNGFVVEESWPGVSMVLWFRRAGLVCQWFCG